MVLSVYGQAREHFPGNQPTGGENIAALGPVNTRHDS